jgi:hypothetical protein
MKSSGFALTVILGRAPDITARQRESGRERERVGESYPGSKKGREDLSVDYPSTQHSAIQTQETGGTAAKERNKRQRPWGSAVSTCSTVIIVSTVL